MVRLDTPTEITDLNDVAFFDQDIFRLDVSMNQALLVQVVDTGANLNEEIECGILTEVLLFSY